MTDNHLSAEELRSLRVTMREYIDICLHGRDVALELQAKEYERRLFELNNAHARAEQMLSITVTRERFDDFEKIMEIRFKDIERRLNINDGAQARRNQFITWSVALAAAIVGLIIFFVKGS